MKRYKLVSLLPLFIAHTCVLSLTKNKIFSPYVFCLIKNILQLVISERVTLIRKFAANLQIFAVSLKIFSGYSGGGNFVILNFVLFPTILCGQTLLNRSNFPNLVVFYDFKATSKATRFGPPLNFLNNLKPNINL